MAIGAFLRLDGATQGQIQGSVIQKGREGMIEVASWSWGAERNFVDGVPAAKAVGAEFHLSKRRDKATPKLLNAFRLGEEMDDWRLDIWDPGVIGGTGAEVLTT